MDFLVGTKKLEGLLATSDRDHLERIFNDSSSVHKPGFDAITKVQHFIKERTTVDEAAATAFQKSAPAERERLLSELVWRLTCFLDGSETAVLGHVTHALGGDFVARQFEKDAKSYVCVELKSGLTGESR